jgi:flagellar hook-associated protein 3 FlgL
MSIGLDGLGAPSGFGALDTAVAASDAIQQQLDKLTEQASTGRVANTYGGLGAQASVSLALAPAIASNQVAQNQINAATGTMQVAQNALSSISSIASNFYSDTNELNGLDSGTVDSIAAQARDALTQVAGLLDTADGDRYVFAGQDSANAPVPDAQDMTQSGFFQKIQTAVQGLATSGSAAVIASTVSIASSNAAGTSPFSAALSQPAAVLSGLRPLVQAGPDQRLPAGILASANADVVSSGPNTTGSYMRDIMRSLAVLGSLSSSQIGTPGFSDLVSDARTTLNNAISDLNDDAGVMGSRQSQLTTMQSTLASTQTALSAQLSNVDDADMATTISDLTATQTQLQASYQVIASFQSLSLVKFLAS